MVQGAFNNAFTKRADKHLGKERKNIEIKEESIKALGTYTAKVRLFKDVSTSISFEVVAE